MTEIDNLEKKCSNRPTFLKNLPQNAVSFISTHRNGMND